MSRDINCLGVILGVQFPDDNRIEPAYRGKTVLIHIKRDGEYVVDRDDRFGFGPEEQLTGYASEFAKDETRKLREELGW